MDKRESALYETLLKNEGETQKWSKYKTDHEDALNNLENFRKKISIEVMVPIGNKAFMPGTLVHTNEVLISHFGKMFSKCTSHQAQEICKNRIKTSNDYLGKLETEKDLFINKLQIPHTYGAMPGAEIQEIIEEYNEEEEKLWREKHKKRVRAEKLKEINSDEDNEKTYEDVMKNLEELEMMDELERELEELGVEDDDTLKKLMSGEIKIKEKPRTSYFNKDQIKGSEINEILPAANVQDSNLEKIYAKYKTIKISDYERNSDSTNNNNIPNDEDFNAFRNNLDSDEVSESSSDSEDPQEFIEIKKEAEEIHTYRKKVNFVRKKIKLIEKEIDSMRVSNPHDLDVKLTKVEARDCLVDYVLTLEDQGDSIDLLSNNVDNKNSNVLEKELQVKSKKNRRISFAPSDDITYIDRNEKVEDMLNRKREQLGKDKIVLDKEFQAKGDVINYEISGRKTKFTIIEKVQENLDHMRANQSHEDFDLVSKIINSSKTSNNTLQIRFKHSPSIYKNNTNDLNENSVESPADFYEMFSEIYPKNLEKQYENFKHETDKKTNNQEKVIDTKIEVAVSSIIKCEPKTEIQTILKNKDAVKKEAHYVKSVQSVKNGKSSKKKKKEIIPRMTLGDVIENPTPEKPDDLPEGNFVDAHAPKKRISKFKQTRHTTS